MVPPPVLIGGMVLDVQATPHAACDVQPGGTVPGQVKLTSGGVARNIAHCLASLLRPSAVPLLISIIGRDAAGQFLLGQWQMQHLPTHGILQKAQASTPMVSVIFTQGKDVAASVADVAAVEQHLGPLDLQPFHHCLQQAPIVLLDANLSPEALQAAAEVAHAVDVPIWFEPVSVPKSVRAGKVLGLLTYISPNAHELIAMALAVDPTHNADLAQQLLLQMAAGSQIHAVGQLKLLAPFLLSVLKTGVKHVVLTMGNQGAALCALSSCGRQIVAQHVPAVPASIVNTSGAGDCLVAGTLARLVQGALPVEALALGVIVAQQALESEDNVPPELSLQKLLPAAHQLLQQCQVLTLQAGSPESKL